MTTKTDSRNHPASGQFSLRIVLIAVILTAAALFVGVAAFFTARNYALGSNGPIQAGPAIITSIPTGTVINPEPGTSLENAPVLLDPTAIAPSLQP